MRILPTLLVLLAVAGAIAWPWWLYARREFPVSGRWLLAAMRAAVLVILVLLVANPGIPGSGAGEGGGGELTLLDASLSMNAAGGESAGSSAATPWQAALATAGDAGGQTLRFGTGVTPNASGPDGGATDDGSKLAPALGRAAELGASRVRVITDLRLEDPVEAMERARDAGLTVEMVDVGFAMAHAGIQEVGAPVSATPGATVEVVVRVFGEGTDSARLTLAYRGDVLREARVALPGPNRALDHTFAVTVPEDSGFVAMEVVVSVPGDGFRADDRASVLMRVGPPEGGIVLVSGNPGWEPGSLLPTLARVTGLPGRGYILLGDSTFLGMGSGDLPPRRVGAPEALESLRSAEMVVLHGFDGPLPPWLSEALPATAPRLLVDLSREALAALGVSAGRPPEGEWFVTPPLPPSAVAGSLAGLDFLGLPPLSGPYPLLEGRGETPVLEATRQGRGTSAPVLILRSVGQRREAVTLARGFWRWAGRTGEAAATYQRVWGGISGWLLQDGEFSGSLVRPDPVVVALGDRPVWTAPLRRSGTVELIVSDSIGAVVARDTVQLDGSGRLSTAPLAAGLYSYVALGLNRADGAEGGVGAGAADEPLGQGQVLVEPRPRDMRSPRVPAERLQMEAAAMGGAGATGGRPLREHPAPYLLGILLLCAEWIIRRRRGLR